MSLASTTAAGVRADSARLAAVSESQAARFRDALIEVGYLPPSPAEAPEVLELRARGGRNLPRLLHATAAGTPLDVFARLFLLGVPVPEPAARAAMNAVPLEEWREAGLVASCGGEVRALLAICPFEGLLLACDKPELVDWGTLPDHVGGITNSTASLAAFMVRRPYRTILDLGTGCGVLGFLAAREGGFLLATDINPRAVDFASFNARLNGLRNTEFAVGDAFGPAEGRRFDLILSNPPCVLGPVVRYAYRDSGMEMDTLLRQIVAAAPAYLEDGGLFQCTAEWPNFASAGWEARPAEWLRETPCDALVVRVEESSVSQHCEQTVGDTDVLDVAEQTRLYAEFASYFLGRNVTSITEGLLALRRRAGGGPNWIRFEAIRGRRSISFGEAVGRYFSVSDALERMGGDLFDARPRMARQLSFLTSRTWNGEAWEEESYSIHQRDGFQFKATVDRRIGELIRRCDGTRTLRALAAEAARSAGIPFEAIEAGCLEVIGQMLCRGFLEL